MTRFAANIGFLFREVPWLERFAAARAAGFDAVEFAWPAAPPDKVIAGVRGSGLAVALINMPAGDLDAGERGHANDPRSRDRWRRDFDAAIDLAGSIGCPVVNVLAGNRVDDVSLDLQVGCLHENLAWALPRARDARVRLVVELLNPIDNPRYLVTTLAAAVELLDAFDGAGLRFQFDTYHVAQVAADVSAAFREVGGRVGHVQIADFPGRHEPGTGGIDWDAFFGALDEAGYEGAVGLEYGPLAGTQAGLGWLRRRRLPQSQRRRDRPAEAADGEATCKATASAECGRRAGAPARVCQPERGRMRPRTLRRSTAMDTPRDETEKDPAAEREAHGLGYTGREAGENRPDPADDGIEGLGFTGREPPGEDAERVDAPRH